MLTRLRLLCAAVRLEILLTIAAAALLLQLFPALAPTLMVSLDPRNHPRSFWFLFNILVVFALCGFRFIPGLVNSRRERNIRRAERWQSTEKQRQLHEQRETFARMKAARKRRLY